ncbi:MAG: hypothetical protein RQ715_00685 [Methylococcales bacterium]|nr:hypothetical protein [Methylococcales bacterium]
MDKNQGYYEPVQRIVIELKLLRKGLEQTLSDGLQQTADHADRVHADEAYLLIFDREPEHDWDSKIWQQTHTLNQRTIAVWGC